MKTAVDIEDPRRLARAEKGESHPFAFYTRKGHFFGVWAPTWRSYSEKLTFFGTDAANLDTPENRDLLYDYLIATGERPDPLLRKRDIYRLRGTFKGHLVNAVSLFALCTFYGSARRRFRPTMTTRERRMSEGKCPRCRYSISGLPTPVCPECGERLD